MPMLTLQEKDFLDVYLHEATTSPFFKGPASKALQAIGVEYKDITYLAWAYHQEVPRTSFEWGRSSAVSPPLPWSTRDAVHLRNEEIRAIWEQSRETTLSVNV
jgi:hypothetical protein